MTTSLKIKLAAAILAVLAASVFTVRYSLAAFSSQTSNPGNQFNAGTVTLTDNDSGLALFDGLSALGPGDSQIGCIEVTYSGSLDPEVRVFGAVTGGTGLEDYLDLTIERGTGTCGAFGNDATVWSTGADGDLGVFLANSSDYATGVDTWRPAGGGPDDTVPYRITVTMQDDNGAQGLASTVAFTWEAQDL